jgi:hypothetical protein
MKSARLALTTATPSKVTKAASNSESLRTTIPADIAKELKIQEGDLIIWAIEETKDKTLVYVEKFERKR